MNIGRALHYIRQAMRHAVHASARTKRLLREAIAKLYALAVIERARS